MKKKCKTPLENFAQVFRLCMVLTLIQHDKKIRKPANNIACTHFYGFSRIYRTIAQSLELEVTLSKDFQIIKCTCTVFIDNLEIFQLTHRYRYQFVGEAMTDMYSIKEMIQWCDPWDSQGDKKCSFYFYCFLP